MSPPTRRKSPDQHAVGQPTRSLRGSTRTIHYELTGDDSGQPLAVRGFVSEIMYAPKVARLLELCEWPCMEAIAEVIASHEFSLGNHLRLDRCAIGAHLAITARCTVAGHPYSEWEVSVHDGREDVARATLAFVVVGRGEFAEQHPRPKTASPACAAGDRAAWPPSPTVRSPAARELNPGSWT